METVYIGLGSNLGDRAGNLRVARARLESADVHVVRISSLYETEPRDFIEQPPFLNQVVEVETSLTPRELLARLLYVERAMGRERTVPKGPRLIDMDILLHGLTRIHEKGLEIPHPRMCERRFVLEPLAEIAPELCIPSHGEPEEWPTARGLLKSVEDQPVRKLV